MERSKIDGVWFSMNACGTVRNTQKVYYMYCAVSYIPYSSKFSWHNNFMIIEKKIAVIGCLSNHNNFLRKFRMVRSGHELTARSQEMFITKINIRAIFNDLWYVVELYIASSLGGTKL